MRERFADLVRATEPRLVPVQPGVNSPQETTRSSALLVREIIEQVRHSR